MTMPRGAGGVAAALLMLWFGPVQAQQPGMAWEPGWTLAPYAWLAGVDGTVGAESGNLDPGFGMPPPRRVDVTLDGDLQLLGAMFYAEWRGERAVAALDFVWVNAKQAADVRLLPVLPSIGAEAGIDGTVTQLTAGYRLTDRDGSALAVYGGIRYYDLEAAVELQGDVLSEPLRAKSSESWADAVVGVHWGQVLDEHWRIFALADYGVGESDASWQLFGTVAYRFDWGSLVGGYRYMNIDYETPDYRVDLALRGPMIGVAFSF